MGCVITGGIAAPACGARFSSPGVDRTKLWVFNYDEIAAFQHLDLLLKQILFALLQDQEEFSAFFRFIDFSAPNIETEQLISKRFHSRICEHANVDRMIAEKPVELAYALSLINSENRWISSV